MATLLAACITACSPTTVLCLLWYAVQRYPITDVRGRGLMVAAEFGGKGGSLAAEPGVASAVTRACGKRGMLLLTSGAGSGEVEGVGVGGVGISVFLLHSDSCYLLRGSQLSVCQRLACLSRKMPAAALLPNLWCAGARETVRFLPPLNVSTGEIQEALSIFEAALDEVFGSS